MRAINKSEIESIKSYITNTNKLQLAKISAIAVRMQNHIKSCTGQWEKTVTVAHNITLKAQYQPFWVKQDQYHPYTII